MSSFMLKAERAEWVMHRLEELYPETPIPLDHKDPFTLLFAVLLSAQCTDARVNTVTPALFDLADNPSEMAQCAVEDIQAIIRPCGLSPRKSKAIAGLSKILMEQHAGEVPQDFAALEALPGVGHKTALYLYLRRPDDQPFHWQSRRQGTTTVRSCQRQSARCGRHSAIGNRSMEGAQGLSPFRHGQYPGD